MLTEQQNPNTFEIDQLSTTEMLQRINAEDATIASVINTAIPQISQAVDGIVERMRKGGRLIYVGAGTSGRLGILDAVECVPTYNTDPSQVQGLIAGGLPALTMPVEGAEDSREHGRDDLLALHPKALDTVVGIAASGRTPYVLAALETANEIGALTVGISCNEPAPVLNVAQIGIALPVGPEVITGSTRMKAGTAQKLVLNMLSTTTMIQLGKVYGNLMVDVRATNEKLVNRAQRIVAQIAEVSLEEAAQLLEACDYEVKTAVVMRLLNVHSAEARDLLNAAQGKLRDVIEGT